MYKIITVLNGQTIWNIALQEYGSGVAGVFKIIQDNGLTINSELESGQRLRIRQDPVNVTVVNFFKNNDLHPVAGPATAMPADNVLCTDIYQNLTTDDEKNLTV